MEIRRLKNEDDPQMLKLMREFWIDYNREVMLSDPLKELEDYKDIDQAMFSELEKYHNWISFVAEEDGELVGYIVGKTNEKPHKIYDKQGYFEEFFVTENQRGQGIGTMLFKKLTKEFRIQGCNQLGIDAYAENKIAIELYKKYGFTPRALVLCKKI